MTQFDRTMVYILAALNGVFVLAVATTLLDDFSIEALVFFTVGVVLTTVGIRVRSHSFIATLMSNRLMLFAPIIWYGFITLILLAVDDAYDTLDAWPSPLWGAVQSWQATIFMWLLFYWLIAYARRSFRFDIMRRRAWLTLTTLTLIVCVLSIPLMFLASELEVQNQQVGAMFGEEPPDNIDLVHRIAYFNTDMFLYIGIVKDFPFDLRTRDSFHHRTVFYMSTSESCQLLDIFRSGYINSTRQCGVELSPAIPAFWLVNFATAIFVALITFELVLHYSGRWLVAWTAAALTTTSPVTIWYVNTPTTDYIEFLIMAVSLWTLHRLFQSRQLCNIQVLAYGLVFGMMLGVKLNITYLIFGVLVAVYLQRWRALIAVSVIPALGWLTYTQITPMVGIPFIVIEATDKWTTVNWVQDVFLHLPLLEMAQAVAETFGATAIKVAFVFGFLLIYGVSVLQMNQRAPRYVGGLLWLMFLSVCAFVFGFRYTYLNHMIGLMPFVYGAVALGIYTTQEKLQDRFQGTFGYVAGLIIWCLPIVHNLVQWVVFNRWTTPI